MLRWRSIFASALVAVVVLVVAPGTASAAAAQQISISGAEQVLQNGMVQQMNVTGTGACGAAGPVTLRFSVTDLDTGATAAPGLSGTHCESAGEQIKWMVTAGAGGTLFRPGDRINIEMTATGAINDTDERQTTLKQFH